MDAEITDRSADVPAPGMPAPVTPAPGTPAPGAPELRDEARELQARLATSVAASLGDTGWAEANLFWAEVADVRLGRLDAVDTTGRSRSHEMPKGLSTLAHELRERMAVPDRGTWFSMTLVVGSGGAFTSRFNFDRRVFDNPASPFTAGSAGALPDDDSYARELSAHPRDAGHTPLWLRSGAESTAAPYDQLNDAWGWPGVFASVEQQTAQALSARSSAGREPDAVPTRDEVDALGRQVLSAVVADVLEPHRLATLLGLHAEAVSRRLLPDVAGASDLDADVTLVEARQTSSAALLAVEAGVYGIIGDVVRAQLRSS